MFFSFSVNNLRCPSLINHTQNNTDLQNLNLGFFSARSIPPDFSEVGSAAGAPLCLPLFS